MKNLLMCGFAMKKLGGSLSGFSGFFMGP